MANLTPKDPNWLQNLTMNVIWQLGGSHWFNDSARKGCDSELEEKDEKLTLTAEGLIENRWYIETLDYQT